MLRLVAKVMNTNVSQGYTVSIFMVEDIALRISDLRTVGSFVSEG